jgi:hypothetical protein
MKIIISESQLSVLRRIPHIDEEAELYFNWLQEFINIKGVTSEMFCKLFSLKNIIDELYVKIKENQNLSDLEFTDEEEVFITNYVNKTYKKRIVKFYKSHCSSYK